MSILITEQDRLTSCEGYMSSKHQQTNEENHNRELTHGTRPYPKGGGGGVKKTKEGIQGEMKQVC